MDTSTTKRPDNRNRGRRVGAAFGLAALIALAACGANQQTSSQKFTSVANAIGGDSKSPDAPAGKAAEADPASLNTNAVDAQGPAAGRSFVSTGTVTVRTSDVAGTKPRAIAAAEHAGGALFGDQSTFGDKARSVLTLKVPPAKFRSFLDELAALGTLSSQEVKTDDVTEKVIDLDARVTAAEASLVRTQALIDRSGNLTELANLEKEVARRAGDLESLRGQQRTLRDRVDLATVTLTLEGEGQVTPAVAEQQAKGLPGFGDGFSGGMRAATTVLTLVAATLGALVPFAPLVALVALLVWFTRRRHREVTGGSAAPPPAPAA